MDAVAVVDVHAVVDVAQHKDHARRRVLRPSHDRMQSFGGSFDVLMRFHVFQQVEAELVQTQIHNGNAVCHILDVDDFFLQTLELRSAIFQVSIFLRIDEVIVAC